MSRKVAVAVVHGIGRQKPDFAEGMITELRRRFADELQRSGAAAGASELVFGTVHWAPALQRSEDRLWSRLQGAGDLDYVALRRFVMNFVADAIAYQPTKKDRGVYDAVHARFARVLRRVARSAGRGAPLCVIAHSLGTVIASNYFYDLQHPERRLISNEVRAQMGDSPLERGETLTLFYTFGSPIAIWGLRYPDFGKPIMIPSPRLARHHPGLKGEWVNFYDQDDIVAYPLKPLNRRYARAVTADLDINAGAVLTGWTPLAHMKYWTDNNVTKPIAKALAELWKRVNAS
jgi:hypothetical protein